MNEIRIIRNLPRSGGTIISKAISSHKNIILLSEIHPDGPKIRKMMEIDSNLGDPLYQFYNWYNFPKDKDNLEIKNTNLNFLEKIKIINREVVSQNKILVIRDWAFIDFLGRPYVKPVLKHSLDEILKKNFNLKILNIVRDPLEIFLSCMRVIPLFSKNYTFNSFLESYDAFIKNFKKENTISYENFCEQPSEILSKINKILNIENEGILPLNLNKINITGDNVAMESNKIFENRKIATSGILNDEQIQKINNNKSYQDILKKLEKFKR